MRVPLVFCMALLAWMAAPVEAGAQATLPAFPVDVATLPNGLTILTVEDHAAPVVSFQVWVRAGSRHERPGLTGLSLLAQHLMFLGARKGPVDGHARAVQAAGGQLDAFTTQDLTAFWEDLPSEKLEVAVQLEAERLQNLNLTEATVQAARDTVKERRRQNNAPREELMAAAFKAHPYGWPVDGWTADLDAITLADARDHFRSRYAPNNVVLVAAGDTTPSDVLRLVKKHFTRWKKQPPPPSAATVEPEQHGERRVVLREPTTNPQVLGAFHIPAAGHADLPALEVAAHLLSDGRTSRLQTRLTPEAVTSSAARLQHPGVFVVAVSTRPQEDPRKVEEALWAEFERLKTEPVPEAEMQKARNQAEVEFTLGLARAHGVGQAAAEAYLLEGSVDAFRTRPARVRAVSAADVQRVARAYFSADNRTVVTVVQP
jgi:predicted Zn-dependent peptidase